MEKMVVSLFGYDKGKSGITRYMNEVVERLKRCNELEVLVPRSEVEYLDQKAIEGVKVTVFDIPFDSTLLEVIFHMLFLPLWITLMRRKRRIFLPAINRRVFAFPVPRCCGTLHDLSQFNVAGKYDFFRHIYVKKVIPLFMSYFKFIFTVSGATKRDAQRYYKLSDNQLKVCYNGLSVNQRKITSTSQGGSFKILYVSRLEWPGKNHKLILDSVSLLPEDIKNKIEVCFVGADWGGAKHIKELSERLSLNVNLLSHIDDTKLDESYKGADLFIHPSFYEGFGLTLLEAMSYGLPCLSSKTSSLLEIGGDSIEYFNPEDSKELSLLIHKYYASLEIRVIQGELAYHRSKFFNWDIHVAQVENLFCEV